MPRCVPIWAALSSDADGYADDAVVAGRREVLGPHHHEVVTTAYQSPGVVAATPTPGDQPAGLSRLGNRLTTTPLLRVTRKRVYALVEWRHKTVLGLSRRAAANDGEGDQPGQSSMDRCRYGVAQTART